MLQHLYTGRRYFGVDPGPIDAVGVAKACGLTAERVTDLDRLGEMVRAFAADPHPLYIDIDVPHMIDYTPPVPAWVDSFTAGAARPLY
jgi:acetolactate synthase-1/2/3 large subunit